MYVGDHVWCGGECFIMSNTMIESGSIIGYKSTVKGNYANNVEIAGIPAKIIRKDVAWFRSSWKDAEEYYKNNLLEEYKRFTED